MSKINECIIIAAKKGNDYILSKNRDRKFISEYKVYHEIYKGVEVAYAEDSTGWIEGMSEHVGFIYTYYMSKDSEYYKYQGKWGIQSEPSIAGYKKADETKHSNKKRDEFKDILTFKTADEAKDYIKTSCLWNGGYFVGDKHGIWEIEHFNGTTEVRRCNFEKSSYKVKTNFGDLIKWAGHQVDDKGIARGNAEVRKTEADRYLLGFKNSTDLLKRMQQRSFTDTSSLNVFRVDDEERTVGQILIDLNNKIFQFIHYEDSSSVESIINKLPKDYEEKIHVYVRDKKEFDRGGEFKQFMQKRKDMYSHYKTFKVDF